MFRRRQSSPQPPLSEPQFLQESNNLYLCPEFFVHFLKKKVKILCTVTYRQKYSTIQAYVSTHMKSEIFKCRLIYAFHSYRSNGRNKVV
jgi:hypothetical protein